MTPHGAGFSFFGDSAGQRSPTDSPRLATSTFLSPLLTFASFAFLFHFPVLSALVVLFPRFISFFSRFNSLGLLFFFLFPPSSLLRPLSSAADLWAITLSVMSSGDQKPLPFVYQFAAGAVAGVSEVCTCGMISFVFWSKYGQRLLIQLFCYVLDSCYV